MGGWVDRSHLDALALLDRTAVQGTSHPGAPKNLPEPQFRISIIQPSKFIEIPLEE